MLRFIRNLTQDAADQQTVKAIKEGAAFRRSGVLPGPTSVRRLLEPDGESDDYDPYRPVARGVIVVTLN